MPDRGRHPEPQGSEASKGFVVTTGGKDQPFVLETSERRIEDFKSDSSQLAVIMLSCLEYLHLLCLLGQLLLLQDSRAISSAHPAWC